MPFLCLRSVAMGCVLTMAAFAQDTLTVPKLIEFVQSSVKSKLQDKDIAAYLAGVRLSQKLEDQTIEELQTAGAGPRTVAALTKLADASAKLPEPPPPPAPPKVSDGGPPPPQEEQDRIIREVQEYARNYIQSLPDFLCLQVTRRSLDMHYPTGTPPSWTPSDRISEKLSFVDHKEKYDLISRNDNAMFGETWKSVGGAISRGDWATLLEAIFDPQTETYFKWERWGNLRGKRYHVYRYVVDKAHSKESLEADHQTTTPAFHGEIFVPMDESIFRRISVEPEPPHDFPMQDVKEVLNYDYVDISGHRFLLPITSDVTMRTGRIGSRNEIEFRRYQKYSADTSISFGDDADSPPADKPQPKTKP
jgi:hypothetical protein